jgi:hypothetical protein
LVDVHNPLIYITSAAPVLTCFYLISVQEQAEGEQAQAEGDQVQAEGDQVQAEGDQVQAEGDQVQAEEARQGEPTPSGESQDLETPRSVVEEEDIEADTGIKKIEEEDRIPEDYFYNYEDHVSKAVVPEDSGLPQDMLVLEYPFHDKTRVEISDWQLFNN